MANIYVRSGAGGTGTGADWTNAKTTLAAAWTGSAAGDSIWVSEDHAETQASAITLTSAGSAASPCFTYCVNHAGTVPPVSADLRTTATVSATGASNIIFAGSSHNYIYGITFNAGSAGNTGTITIPSANTATYKFQSCAFVLNNTSVSSLIQLGANGVATYVEWVNCTATFGSASQSIATAQTWFKWSNTATAIVGATIPTTLLSTAGTSRASVINLEGVDLAALGSGTTIVGALTGESLVTIKDCKLGSSVTVAATVANLGGASVYLIRGDSSGTNYRHEKYNYVGTQTVETTIVRTGGASDGTTTIASKLVTTANSRWVLPFEAIPITIWNDGTSAITVTVYGTTTGGGVPKDDEIWIDVEYLGSSGSPLGSFKTSTKADNLAASAATNNSADGSTWGGGGAGNGFKMVTPSFTPGQKGYLNITVKAAKASSTYYIDPLVVVT